MAIPNDLLHHLVDAYIFQQGRRKGGGGGEASGWDEKYVHGAAPVVCHRFALPGAQ